MRGQTSQRHYSVQERIQASATTHSGEYDRLRRRVSRHVAITGYVMNNFSYRTTVRTQLDMQTAVVILQLDRSDAKPHVHSLFRHPRRKV